MTQDVQPLTWQKRTNIEEHQQFFSKINEIIGNLAPTVDEAEAAIAQATAAIASANDAVATANAASAAASAAASQAQTAASAVAGYDGRLTAAEGDIAAIEGREPDYLKKAGAAQTVTSQIMVPTTATGTRDTQIANGTRVQNDLAAYEPMVRNTGNVSIYGRKAINVAAIRNLNGEGTAASCLELFRFRPTSGQDHRFNFFCQLGMGVCHVFLRIQIPAAGSIEIIDGTKTPIGNSSGNITIGVGINADGWCVVYEKENASCIFCNLLTAFTGSRFPLKEGNVDMSQQCNTVELTDLLSIKEVTL